MDSIFPSSILSSPLSLRKLVDPTPPPAFLQPLRRRTGADSSPNQHSPLSSEAAASGSRQRRCQNGRKACDYSLPIINNPHQGLPDAAGHALWVGLIALIKLAISGNCLWCLSTLPVLDLLVSRINCFHCLVIYNSGPTDAVGMHVALL